MGKQNKGKPGTYLRRVPTGPCYAWRPHKAKRADMEPWTGPLPCEGGKTKPNFPAGHGPVVQELPEMHRKTVIRKAILEIAPSNYSKAIAGYPPMPKVAAVSYIAGFSVTREEIAGIMKELIAEKKLKEVEQPEPAPPKEAVKPAETAEIAEPAEEPEKPQE